MRGMLMVAFHYPPCRGSSGVHRTLKFSSYLPDHGWQPMVLTAHPRAYPQIGDDQLHDIREDIVVRRVMALDTARHLSIRGAYARWMTLPDRWVSWWFGAVCAGLRLIHQHRPKVIWSTYPIATAHLIGLTLHYIHGIPWVADFRDSMTEADYPRDAMTRQIYRWIERKTIRYSSRVIFTTVSTRQMYLQRYPELRPEQCLVVPNGYDEDDFKYLTFSQPGKEHDGYPIRLLHAGVIYPEERDPRPFFKAISRLRQEGQIDSRNLQIDLRACGSEHYYSVLIQKLEIDDIVHLLPALPYRQSLQDCANADALLLFQAASCNHQIPAKVYEYLRLSKPILALTAAKGDTAALLKEIGGAMIVDLNDEQKIYQAIPHFLSILRHGAHPLPNEKKVQSYTREEQTRKLARCLDQLVNPGSNVLDV